jgi:hypothetical protein
MKGEGRGKGSRLEEELKAIKNSSAPLNSRSNVYLA